MLPIGEIAAPMGIPEAALELHGLTKAKISMPGLPSAPSAATIDIDAAGKVVGLFWCRLTP